MKPAWDKLMENWNKEPRIESVAEGTLIEDVDCTAEGKALCELVGVKGYPTIQWGVAGKLQDYEGGRDYDALKKWAEENLKPMCSPSNIDLCDDETKQEIVELQNMSAEDLDAKVEEGKAKIKAAEATFTEEVKKLNVRGRQLQKDKDAEIAEIRSSGLVLMQAVEAHARKDGTAEDEELLA